MERGGLKGGFGFLHYLPLPPPTGENQCIQRKNLRLSKEDLSPGGGAVG